MSRNAKEVVAARKAERVERLHGEVERMLGLLKRRPDIRKVILAGSLARNEGGTRSDVDLVVIQDTGKRFLDRLGELYSYLVPRVAADILVYTPKEWEDLPASRSFFRRLRKEGVVLYEAQRT